MKDFERYRNDLDAYWPAVDAYFDELPGTLYRQGRLIRENLAAAHSQIGNFHDILRRPEDPPWLQHYLWLLDDLGAGDDDRPALERRLFGTSVLGLCIIELHRGLQAPDSFIDVAYVGLLDALTRRATTDFAAVIEAGAPFWDTHQAVWDAAADVDAPTDAQQAPLLLSVLAALDATGDRDRTEDVLEMLTDLNAVLATRHDLLNIRRDLTRGRITEPLRQMMDAVGLQTDSSPESILGSLLLSGAVDSIAPEWRARIETAAATAHRIGLPTFARYGKSLDTSMEAIRAVSRLPAAELPTGEAQPQFASASDPLPEAVAMAERFLTADPTMREAWEVHRWGMAGAPEVTARFPAGLVIEALGKHGTDVADLVDNFYEQAAAKGFAYYDHPDLPYVETDTLGTMLRLYRYSKQTEWHRQILDDYLALLEALVGAGDRLPVWLQSTTPTDVLLGEGCGTIEANLLRGLIEYDADRLAPLIELPAQRLIEDFRRRGAGITVNYPRPYLLAVLADLFAVLGDTAPWEHLADQIEIEATRDRLTPMTAASLMLAGSHARTDHLLEDQWGAAILKGQRFDGGWAAEPMFFAPSRGRSMTWYSSRLVTSALCYDAVMTARTRLQTL